MDQKTPSSTVILKTKAIFIPTLKAGLEAIVCTNSLCPGLRLIAQQIFPKDL